MLKFTNYLSPASEQSTLKNIPIEKLEDFRTFLKAMRAAGFLKDVVRIRYRFRGPRIHNDRHTLKSEANTFAIYLDKFYYTYRNGRAIIVWKR